MMNLTRYYVKDSRIFILGRDFKLRVATNPVCRIDVTSQLRPCNAITIDFGASAHLICCLCHEHHQQESERKIRFGLHNKITSAYHISDKYFSNTLGLCFSVTLLVKRESKL